MQRTRAGFSIEASERAGQPMRRRASRRLVTLGCAGLLVATACAAPVSARDDVPEDIAARSNPVTLEDDEIRYYARQYRGKCAHCHGADGTGSGDDAAMQPVRPTNFTDAAHMKSRTDGQLFYQILMGGGDRCAMPAFGPDSDHAWTEDKIWHMVAYVRRFAEPSP